MKSPSGKRPPDEAHGPGKGAINQTAEARPGEIAKRGCTLARFSSSGSMDCADANDKACDARHGARVVQIVLCFALLESNRKTMKSAAGKRPPDMTHSAPKKKLSSRISCA